MHRERDRWTTAKTRRFVKQTYNEISTKVVGELLCCRHAHWYIRTYVCVSFGRSDVVNEEVPGDEANARIYNYTSSNYKPCSWSQLGEKFFKNEKAVSSPNFVIRQLPPYPTPPSPLAILRYV